MALTRSIIWRWIGALGTEYCTLVEDVGSASLEGTVITAFDGEPALVLYRIACDGGWRTSNLSLSMYQASGRRNMNLPRYEHGWRTGAAESEERLRDCIDVDLSVTPSTNTLPIRRLNLAVGESAEVTAAWVRFPMLDVQPLRQRYTRLAPDRYRYESLESDFTAELSVDDLGLVMHYPGGWEQWTPERPAP